jgi:hypothetical protein
MPTEAETAAAAASAAAAAAAGPWHKGVDAVTLGFWNSKGYDISDPTKVALAATKAAISFQENFGVPPAQLLKLPADAKDEAGWKAVHQRLGAPADPKEYDFSSIKDLDPKLDAALRPALHARGVTKDAAIDVAKAMVAHQESVRATELTERTAKLAEQKANLTKNWGANETLNREIAKQGAARLGVTPDDVQALENQIGYDRLMEMFRKIGAGTREDTFQEGLKQGGPQVMTADGAKTRLAELMKDGAWQKRLLAGDGATVREWQQLEMMKLNAA